MSTDRHELHDLVDELPDEQVPLAIADVRRRLSVQQRDRQWPPRFFGIGTSRDGRTDNARRVDDLLAEGFGAPRS